MSIVTASSKTNRFAIPWSESRRVFVSFLLLVYFAVKFFYFKYVHFSNSVLVLILLVIFAEAF